MSNKICNGYRCALRFMIAMVGCCGGAYAQDAGVDCLENNSCKDASYALGVLLAFDMPNKTRPFDAEEIIKGFKAQRQGGGNNKMAITDAIEKLEYYLNSPNSDEQKIIDDFLTENNLTFEKFDGLKYSSYELSAPSLDKSSKVSEYIDAVRNQIGGESNSQTGKLAIDTVHKALLPIKDRQTVDDMNDEVTVSYRRVELKLGKEISNGEKCIGNCDSDVGPMLVHDNWTTKRFPLMGVIEGWREGMRGMREGDLRRLQIRPSKAYGNKEVKGVRSGETLIYELYLHQVH